MVDEKELIHELTEIVEDNDNDSSSLKDIEIDEKQIEKP